MHLSPTDASQSNGCFDPAVVEQLITMGAAQAWQQLQVLQGEFSKRFEVQHQPAPVTPVHVPGRSRRKGHVAARWVNWHQGAAMRGFQLVLFLILLGSQGLMVKATEEISTHQGADHIAADPS